MPPPYDNATRPWDGLPAEHDRCPTAEAHAAASCADNPLLAVLGAYYGEALTLGLVPEVWSREGCEAALPGEDVFFHWAGERPYLIIAAPGRYDIYPLGENKLEPGVIVTRRLVGYILKESAVKLQYQALAEALEKLEVPCEPIVLEWGGETISVTCQPWEDGYALTAAAADQVAQLCFAPRYEAVLSPGLPPEDYNAFLRFSAAQRK